MILPIISCLSKIVSNSAYFCARAIIFGWMLDHVVVDVHAKLHRQMLARRRIKVLQVRNLHNHDFAHYFLSFKNCFLLGLIFTHAIKFGLMLDHGVFLCTYQFL